MWTEEARDRSSERWTLLRGGGQESSGLEIPTLKAGVFATTGPVRLALGDNGEPRVLLPIERDEDAGGLSGAPSLRIDVSTFSLKGELVRFLDLACLSRELEAVFAEVVDEMLARIAGGASCVDAAQSTLNDFRTLLLKSPRDDIAAPVVAGLVAELMLLDRLLDRSEDAWRAWRGPLGDRHDFRRGDTSLEVKASLRGEGQIITVNGLDQLEPPSGGRLHLLHLNLEPVASGMLGVSALVRSALRKASASDRITELLAAVGCGDPDADEWNQQAFRLNAETLYEVTESFPRIAPSTLMGNAAPAGISNVSYRVDLSVASSMRRTGEQYLELEAQLAS